MRLSLIDSLSSPGAPERANEDAFGATGNGLFVIDGATGLSDSPIMAPTYGATDAAWLARFAADRLIDALPTAESGPPMIRSLCQSARDAYFASGGADAPRYGWPSSALQLLWLRPDGVLETLGLGDCKLIMIDSEGRKAEASGPQLDRAREQAFAREALNRNGGFAAQATLRDPETLSALRERRAAQNTPGDYWTLGLVPEAADHLAVAALDIAPPARGLLMTDGFADLIDLYAAYDAAALIDATFDRGLAPLIDELRKLERDIDPHGAKFPRFKQSDDATALAFELLA